jgi:hypothetical protein
MKYLGIPLIILITKMSKNFEEIFSIISRSLKFLAEFLKPSLNPYAAKVLRPYRTIIAPPDNSVNKIQSTL